MPKTCFSGLFSEVFCLLTPFEIRLHILENKKPYCGCQVNTFQSFAYQINIHAVPKYGQILLKFALEVTFQQTKTLFEERLKNLNFFANRTDPKVCTFGPNLNPRFPLKMTEIKKVNIFQKNKYF